MRQVDARARGLAPRGAHVGDAHARRRRRGPGDSAREAGAAPLGPDGVPEPLRIAQPAQEDRRDPRGAARDQHDAARRRARGTREGDARPRGLASRALRPLSAHVLRRTAPAHRDRARADAEPRARRRRRAGVGARRLGAGAGAEPDGGPPGRAAARLPVHLSRPRRRAAHRARGAGHVPRPRDGAGADRAHLRAPAAPVHGRRSSTRCPRWPGPGRGGAGALRCRANSRPR